MYCTYCGELIVSGEWQTDETDQTAAHTRCAEWEDSWSLDIELDPTLGITG